MRRGEPGLAAVLRQLRRQGGAGLEWYQDGCLVRRIETRMRTRGVDSLAGYAGLLARDRAETARLLRLLSVGVTGFFRNPDTWLRLLEVLDRARPGTPDRLTGWSMGCSTGQEAWSLGMVLLRHARRSGGPADSAVQVVGSDRDEAALAIARRGRYPARAATPILNLLGEPFGPIQDDRYEIGPELRGRVDFRHENLIVPVAAPARHDLICCRNLLIFLGPEGRRRILETALRALRPGGLLVLGRTESPTGVPADQLETVDSTHRIYRKPR